MKVVTLMFFCTVMLVGNVSAMSNSFMGSVNIAENLTIMAGHVMISGGDLHLDGSLIHDMGSVSFTNGNFSIDGDAFFINPIDKRIGIGTVTPATELDVNGSITATGGSSTDWNTAYSHSQDNSQAHSDYLKNNGDDSTTGRLTSTGFISSIFESATGNLKLQASAIGDVVLFSSADVNDSDDGKELKIWRNAPEGNNYIRTYITSTQNALLHSNTNMLFQNADGKNIQFNSGQHIYLNLGDGVGSDEVKIRDNGGNEIATIDSNGNAWFEKFLSIGGSVANSRLSIVGNESGEHTNNAGLTIQNTATGGDTWYLRTGSNGTTTPPGGFSIADTSSYRFTIDENGNVGIGTVSPTKKLEVNGDTLIHGELETDNGIIINENIQVNGTVDGRDVATDGTKLDGIATGAEVATKEFFLPAGSGILDNNAVHTDDAIVLPDGVTFARAYFNFHLPSDFSSMASGYPKIVIMPGTGGGGNVRIAFNSQSGGVGEQLGSSIDNIVEYTKAVSSTSNIIIEEDISNAFDSLSLSTGDSVSFFIQRDSDDAGDTFSGGLDIVGVIIKYD